jgi:hypothetical protein
MVYILHHEIVTGRLVLCDGSKTGAEPKKCFDCRFWRGICAKRKKNRIAKDVACPEFEPKTDNRCDFLKYTT